MIGIKNTKRGERKMKKGCHNYPQYQSIYNIIINILHYQELAPGRALGQWK